jgi:hypothetical protein
MKKNTIDILLEKVDQTDSCWLYLGKPKKDGYVIVNWNGSQRLLHRIFYEHYRGPIPEELVCDHLCRVRSCCNPDHIELVTSQQNTLRGIGPAAKNSVKTHCYKGHEFTEENLYSNTTYRRCKQCAREKALKAYYATRRS